MYAYISIRIKTQEDRNPDKNDVLITKQIEIFVPYYACLHIYLHRVVIALCGGNIDTTVLGRAIDRGLAADGRLNRFVVTVSDRPGGVADLTKMLASKSARYVVSFFKKELDYLYLLGDFDFLINTLQLSKGTT